MATDIAPVKIEDITARLFKASVHLEKSSDFAAQISRITTLLREQILPFVQLSYYQLDNYPDSVYHYFLHPSSFADRTRGNNAGRKPRRGAGLAAKTALYMARNGGTSKAPGLEFTPGKRRGYACP